MQSELQRVAERMLACLTEAPRAVGYLHDRARKCRDAAAWIGNQSSNPNARMAAMQLDDAARRCEEAAHHLSMAEARAKQWVEQMVSGIRTVEPTRRSADNRPLFPGRKQSPGQPRHEEPKANKSAGTGDEVGPEDESPTARVSDEEGRRLFGKLPKREESAVGRPKTRGIWKDADDKEHPLTSGRRNSDSSGDDPYYQQVKEFMREHRIGRQDADPMVASHVEAKFALFMRERGLMHETIVVNKVPCPGRFGCDQLLKLFLPPGGTLTIFGPDGFKQTYPKPE
ncbi:DddA-like double-stranded DNA deaminase toxin [Kribbella sp. NPDC059898]|uniref:DddA-like double-stranded DNA deaminase toxin n=1 Tax=Kribbella sp. NPDC059898 TaxID=3346995 RepID=UPI003659F3A1